jgi:hypothetical protein
MNPLPPREKSMVHLQASSSYATRSKASAPPPPPMAADARVERPSTG